ncbi:hypothetical protein GSI_15656 [Ganoderma sinense ZZ0214-1]|uniref:Uncharacterized protein n=1 Tax=Ganoderma sinense ZZ0214-1 TaxID=1077348 RepID=A0A2G8RN73_9APHY|nr:hypothetical protein GSI_15656 [Ganoderma sinense ZZ0214-1]
MGRSAKFHKRQATLPCSYIYVSNNPHNRQDKKKTSSAGSGSGSTPAAQQPPSAAHLKPKPKPKTATAAGAPTPKEQKKRAGLKDKAKASASARRRDGDGPVLGGADYVELMLGGRRRAAAEAAKLPQDPDALFSDGKLILTVLVLGRPGLLRRHSPLGTCARSSLVALGDTAEQGLSVLSSLVPGGVNSSPSGRDVLPQSQWSQS